MNQNGGNAHNARSRPLSLHVLASGSRGNAAIVHDRQADANLIIDCGICKRDFFARAATLGQHPERSCGLLITHDHTDHTKGLGVVLRALFRQVGRLPLYASERVRAVSAALQEVIDQDLVEFHELTPGDRVNIGPFAVTVFPTSHDAAESFGFRISVEDAGEMDSDISIGADETKLTDELGYVTDTGYLTPEAFAALRDVRLLAIESNHDRAMLANGPYPASLKARVASDYGHLSNDQAADAVVELAHEGLEQVIAMHVSQNNNTYQRAVQALTQALEHRYPAIAVQAAYQDRPISIF